MRRFSRKTSQTAGPAIRPGDQRPHDQFRKVEGYPAGSRISYQTPAAKMFDDAQRHQVLPGEVHQPVDPHPRQGRPDPEHQEDEAQHLGHEDGEQDHVDQDVSRTVRVRPENVAGNSTNGNGVPPPRNRAVARQLTAKTLRYSARKNRPNRMPEYSVW